VGYFIFIFSNTTQRLRGVLCSAGFDLNNDHLHSTSEGEPIIKSTKTDFFSTSNREYYEIHLA